MTQPSEQVRLITSQRAGCPCHERAPHRHAIAECNKELRAAIQCMQAYYTLREVPVAVWTSSVMSVTVQARMWSTTLREYFMHHTTLNQAAQCCREEAMHASIHFMVHDKRFPPSHTCIYGLHWPYNFKLQGTSDSLQTMNVYQYNVRAESFSYWTYPH